MGETQELDLVNRDPNSLNPGLQVAFADVFGEPDSSHSPDCAWKCTYKCYEGARKICYIIMTVLCGWFAGCCAGCDFAYLTFCAVYCWTPCLKQVQLVVGLLSKFFHYMLECVLVPICAACGMMFSNIKVTNVSG